MPQLTVEGFASVEVETGKRLVLAIEQDAGVDILHACGGNARCTTCRVEFIRGEPETMTVAERNVLAAKGVTGVRLSCQILCDHDMTVRAVSRLDGSGRPDPGGPPAPEITPPPEWIPARARPGDSRLSQGNRSRGDQGDASAPARGSRSRKHCGPRSLADTVPLLPSPVALDKPPSYARAYCSRIVGIRYS